MIWWCLALGFALMVFVILVTLEWWKYKILPDDDQKDSMARTKGELPHGYSYKERRR